MGTVVKKRESRRRLTAVNFLKNITLDGSKRQLDQQNVYLVKQQLDKSNQLCNGHAIDLKDEELIQPTTVQETFRQPLAQIDSNDENKLNQIGLTKTITPVTNVKIHANQNGYIEIEQDLLQHQPP